MDADLVVSVLVRNIDRIEAEAVMVFIGSCYLPISVVGGPLYTSGPLVRLALLQESFALYSNRVCGSIRILPWFRPWLASWTDVAAVEHIRAIWHGVGFRLRDSVGPAFFPLYRGSERAVRKILEFASRYTWIDARADPVPIRLTPWALH